MSSKPPPSPSPSHILRTHVAQVNVIHFSDDNERLYSGDSSGTVTITSTRTLRPTAVWQAHTDGLLGIQEWEDSIITHGRDNKLHVWSAARDAEPASTIGQSAASPGLQTPTLRCSMDVNALNYCRFSLLPRREGQAALIALPNLVESSLADIWDLSSQQRLHAAIGKAGQPSKLPDGRGANPTGIIMSIHLYEVAHPHIFGQTQLRLLCAYENGGVTAWGYTRSDRETSVEGAGWESIWNVRLHVESVMAMAVSRDNSFALTVSADHLIGRYDLQARPSRDWVAAEEAQDTSAVCTIHRTKHPGNGSVAIRDDGRVCAVGGWDGKVRLYSTKSVKPLGTLVYHKKNCQSVSFARYGTSAADVGSVPGDDSEGEMGEEDQAERSRWLAVGSQDCRVSIWGLMNFSGGT
ncbi:hypothetical protein IEO21_09207 [Rhodonia placenta]|uniref:ASTRA-associated protein 1 n=1 Tax=Rhodonia placenta TaxID=104341 RepID=A0A8H7NUP7_9APHY|nr:hypothetical protein IEO21_09207 [Postia placenta]